LTVILPVPRFTHTRAMAFLRLPVEYERPRASIFGSRTISSAAAVPRPFRASKPAAVS